MAKMVYSEWYGTMTYAQRAAYRKHNVSPSDHQDLVAKFGEDNHTEITAAVKQYSAKSGMFDTFEMWRNE